MDAASVQNRIYAGYAQVAAHVGMPYQLCRANGPANPLANVLNPALLVSPTQLGEYRRPNSYGHALWWSFHDARLTQVGDYLVGDQGTFFIASQQDLLPVQLVRCNRLLSVYAITQNVANGPTSYSGQNDGNDTAVLTNWPASVLEGSKGEENSTDLPLDVKNPWWVCLLPASANVNIALSMRVMDELGNRYLVHSAEQSALGWRLKLQQVQA